MDEPHIDDLTDHFELLAAHLELRAGANEETLRSAVAAQGRIAARVGEAVPLQLLRRNVGLSESELLSLVLLVGFELDDRLRSVLARENSTAAGVRPEVVRRIVFGVARSTLAAHSLSREGLLATLGLIAERRDATGTAYLVATERAIEIAHARSDSSLRPARRQSGDASNWVALGDERATDKLISAMSSRTPCVAVVSAAPGTGRRTLARSAATMLGRVALVVDVGKLSGDDATVRDLCRGVALEARLHGAVLILANIDRAVRPEVVAALIDTTLPLLTGAVVATCGLQRSKLDWGRPVVTVEMGKPSTAQLVRLWHEKLGQGTPEDGERLAEQYPLAPAMIHHACEAAKARAGDRPLVPDDIFAGIRTVLDDKLGAYAKRVTVTQKWEDVVLPQEQVDTIIELEARVKRRSKVYEQWGFADKVGRGLGVSALFSGPPGTGKTMVAGLIARDLGLDLFQVDMSKVVSKFIGESEKNLGALFDAAEAGHAILLFDEADALFGKRTEVKSSNDRYANLETNYLLQRLESFTGVCLLTSNHESNIDPAFQRRLSLHLRFELPDEDERAQLWQATLPAAAPVAANVDFASLGRRFVMSGGYIRNAALRAAFIAADEGGLITEAHMERAARVEYEGMGKIAA